MESDAYPYPTRPGVTAVMKGNRKTDTKPELALRSALHRSGLRFRKDHTVKVDEGRTIRVDVAFPRAKLAVFVDGCFWHGCPQHGTVPRSNTGYWGPKLAGNVARDHKTDERLRSAGWAVLRIWEHETVEDACARVQDQVVSSKPAN
ncbi:MAG: very short patch repair endonuclease [Acidimicrobiia bacterium]